MRGNVAALTASLFVWVCAKSVFAASVVETAPTAPTAQNPAPRVVTAADHAELRADIAQNGVVRVALLNDRIDRVVHAPGVWRVEHDTGAGDVFIRRLPQSTETVEPVEPVESAEAAEFFIGSEQGFTYSLKLRPVAGGASQLLIRNPAIEDAKNAENATSIAARMTGDARVADIAALIRAVANREALPGFLVERNGRAGQFEQGIEAVSPLENESAHPEIHVADSEGIALLEVWRGARIEALVLGLSLSPFPAPAHPIDPRETPVDAKTLASLFAPGVLAAWIDDEDTQNTQNTRIAVIVREGVGHVGR